MAAVLRHTDTPSRTYYAVKAFGLLRSLGSEAKMRADTDLAAASKNEAGDRMAVLIGNIWPDPIEAPVLETDGNWTPVETVNAEAVADGNFVRLSRIESFGYAAVLLTLTDRQ